MEPKQQKEASSANAFRPVRGTQPAQSVGVRVKDGYLVIAANNGGYWCAVPVHAGAALKLAEQIVRAARLSVLPGGALSAPSKGA